MTNTLKLTMTGNTIKVKIALETEVAIDAEGKCDLAEVIAGLGKRMLKASRNTHDFDEVMIDSSGKMTCNQFPEAGTGDGEE